MSAGAAAAQVTAAVPLPAANIETAADAFAQDAGEYARHYGVAPDEAIRRLHAQEESVPATDALRDEFRDRLAGIYLEHQPEFRIVVLLTGEEQPADRSVYAGGMAVPIVFRTGAPATREQVLAAIRLHQADIRAALQHPPGMGVDPRSGTLLVVANPADVAAEGTAAWEERLTAIAGVPVRIASLDPEEVNTAIEGGGRVVGLNPADGLRYACTTGFAVTDGTRTGLITAAHCPDALSFRSTDGRETPLDFVGQWGWGYQDVQVNVSPDPLDPLFYANTAKTLARPVQTWRTRPRTRSGDVVCHRGERTGYSCAEIGLVDFAPAGDLCGGACLPTWVTVEGPDCRSGDSGAPVFNGTVAFGIVKGASYRADGACSFYYYMSTDYLPQGWSLLHQ